MSNNPNNSSPPVVLPEPVAWRHSRTYDLHETEDEVQLADGDEHAEPLYTEQQVHALLAGVSAPAVFDGCRLVPEVPTEKMSQAAFDAAGSPSDWYGFGEMWRAALASAPEIAAQKAIFVLGSAPNAVIPSEIGRYFVIAANGAIAAFPDLVPDVLMLNGYALVENHGVGPETRSRLRGRRVKKLIVIDNLKKSDKSTASRVLELGIQYEDIEFWSKVGRAETCTNASGIQYAGLTGNDIPSTGVTAICYALSLSNDVTISGINVESDGHSYSGETHKRGHIEVDSKTLEAMAGKFKVFDAQAAQQIRGGDC